MNFENSFDNIPQQIVFSFKNKDYQKTLDQVIIMLKKQTQLNYAHYYYVLQSSLNLDEYKLAYLAAQEGIAALNQSDFAKKKELNIFFNFKKALCLEKLNEFEKAIEAYEYLQNIKYDSDWLQYEINQKLNALKDGLTKITKATARTDEIGEYESLLKKQEEQKYFDKEGMMAYIIEKDWLEKFYAFHGKKQLKRSHCEQASELIRLLGQQEFVSEIASVKNPGPIMNSSLMEDTFELFTDKFAPKDYCNYVLSSRKFENKDYIFVSYYTWKYLQSLYGGRELKRLIICTDDDKDTCQIETNPLQIKIIIYPQTNENKKIFDIRINCKEYMDNLINKIKFNFPVFQADSCRVLRFKQSNQQKEFLNNYLKANLPKRVMIEAEEMENKLPIEDLNISQDDVYLMEFTSASSSFNITINNQKIIQQKLKELGKFSISQPLSLSSNLKPDCGVCGLNNLGNTCFMNSAIQCLSQCVELTEFLVSNQFLTDLNPQNPIGAKGYLATCYAELLKQIWSGQHDCVSPNDFKKVIGKFAQQFVGFGQQDSQELLYYLLDGLNEDLNRIQKKQTTEQLDCDNDKDEVAALKFLKEYKKRNDSVITDYFMGQFKSTVKCPYCKRIAKNFDPFLCVSLPIQSNKHRKIEIELYFISKNDLDIPKKYQFNISPDALGTDIAKNVQSQFKVKGEVYLLLLQDLAIVEKFDLLSKTAEFLSTVKGMIFAYEIDTISSNCIEISLIILDEPSFKEDSKLTYPRLFGVEQNIELSSLYLMIYKKFRRHLKFMFETLKKKHPLYEYFIQIEETDNLEILQKEIQLIADNLQGVPFIITLPEFNVDLKLGMKGRLQDILQKYKKDVDDTLEISLVFNKIFNKKELKLNNCEQHKNEEKLSQSSLNLYDCFELFSQTETLEKGNEWYCNKCKKHVLATKKMELYYAPELLIVHLKRFNKSSGSIFGNSQKISKLVDFPIRDLNLNKLVLSKSENTNIDFSYDLIAVSNHYGSFLGGHYTAYGFNKYHKQWYDFNDSSVRRSNESQIVSDAAYVLIYRRRKN